MNLTCGKQGSWLVNCQDILSNLTLSWHYVCACLKSYTVQRCILFEDGVYCTNALIYHMRLLLKLCSNLIKFQVQYLFKLSAVLCHNVYTPASIIAAAFIQGCSFYTYLYRSCNINCDHYSKAAFIWGVAFNQVNMVYAVWICMLDVLLEYLLHN